MISIGRDRLIADIARAALPFLGDMTEDDARALYAGLSDGQLERCAAGAYLHEAQVNLSTATCLHHIRGRCPICDRQYRGFRLVPEGSTVVVHAPDHFSPHGPWRLQSDAAARRFIDRWLERIVR